MWRRLGIFSGICLAALAAAFMLPPSPLYMPTTDCRPDRTRHDSLVFGQSFEAVSRHMGCRGVRALEERLSDDLSIVTYVWRTDSWPVGIARLTFYNDTLQAKSSTRLDLRLNLPK